MNSILISLCAAVVYRRVGIGTLFLAGVLLYGCASARQVLRITDEGPCVTVNNVESSGTPRASDRKVIVVNFVFNEGGIQSQGPVVTFGRGQTPVSQGCNYLFLLVGAQDELLAQFGIWDPRQQISDDKPTGFVVAQQASYAARFPFTSRAKEIKLLNSRREQVTVVNVSGAVRTFCLKHGADDDCKDVK